MKAVIGILAAVLVVICIIVVASQGFNIYSIIGLLFIAILVLGALFGGTGKKQDNDNDNNNNNDNNNSNE